MVGGVRILATESARLRALGEPPDSPALRNFVGIFEPIVELGHQRLDAGNEGDLSRAKELELLIAELADEQSAAAREAGMDACSVNFFAALGGST